MIHISRVTVSIIGIYLAASWIVSSLFNPIQNEIAPELTKYVSLTYIPHGLRVFAISLFGVIAIPGLIIGDFISGYVFWNIQDPILLVLLSIATGIVCWAIFRVLKAIGVNAYYLQHSENPPLGQDILLAGMLTSVGDAFVSTAILEQRHDINDVSYTMAGFMVGNLTGFLVCILLAKLTLRVFYLNKP